MERDRIDAPLVFSSKHTFAGGPGKGRTCFFAAFEGAVTVAVGLLEGLHPGCRRLGGAVRDRCAVFIRISPQASRVCDVVGASSPCTDTIAATRRPDLTESDRPIDDTAAETLLPSGNPEDAQQWREKLPESSE
jgi:hypothetical protein